jgi:hypothetical protein
MIAILQLDSVSMSAFNHLLAGDRLPRLIAPAQRRRFGWKSWTDAWQRCALVQSALDFPVHGVDPSTVVAPAFPDKWAVGLATC